MDVADVVVVRHPLTAVRRQLPGGLLAAWGDWSFVERALAGWVDNPEPVTCAVEIPARTFRQWALEHADDFRPPALR